MQRLELLLRNERQCEFAVVTIPTELAAAESRRLLAALDEEGVLVRRLVVNQVLPESAAGTGGGAGAGAGSDEAEAAFLGRMRAVQRASLGELRREAEAARVPLLQVPYFDTEVRTVFGLRLIGRFLFAGADGK